MKPWISYKFGKPKQELPLYTAGITSYQPCHYWWQPSIYCEDVSQQTGVFYADKPFPRANIKEIYVESIRAYHLLKRHNFVEDWEGIIRIIPPVPAPPTEHARIINTVSFAYDEREMIASSKIVAKLGGCACLIPSAIVEQIMTAAKVAIFPNKQSVTSLWLCAAISAGCRIVSSDAGSADEYLSKYAQPGTWHVIHSHKQLAYEQAAAHLLGRQSNIDLSTYVDEAPYE